MFNKIKNKIENELADFSENIEKTYHLKKISPVIYSHIKDFILRPGKRLRPALFCAGYLGFSKKPAIGLYRSSLGLELLHDFMLIHDDIIDRSDLRRGKPAMHSMLNQYLKDYPEAKFNGQDLAIIIADIIYALAYDAFLSIKEKPIRKENALKIFIKTTVNTGSGEFIELLYSAKNLNKLSQKDIYNVYDLKTAYYTFAYPLAMGAAMAGVSQKEQNVLFDYGMKIGRAFQIKDDILGIFGDTKETGKSIISDLVEGKRTILLWKAYKNSNTSNKKFIENILSKKNIGIKDLETIKNIMIESGSLDHAKKEIVQLSNEAEKLIKSSNMKSAYLTPMSAYSQKILDISNLSV